MLIQNLDTIFLKVTPDTQEVFLPKDRFLHDRNISYLMPFTGDEFITKAPDGVDLIDVSLKEEIYCNLYELDKDYKANNYNISLMVVENLKKFKLDCELDFDLSLFKLKQNVTANCYLPVCAVYTTEADEVNTSTTSAINIVCEDLLPTKVFLKDIGGYKLNNKRIKKISVLNPDNCYITIRTKDNKNNINDLPLFILENMIQIADNDITFDSLLIDSDNSYITISDTKLDKLKITFKY